MRWMRGWRLGLLLTALLLTACAPTGVGGTDGTGGTGGSGGSHGPGSTPTASATPAHAALSCTVATSIQGVDVIKQVLTCTVTGAPTSETGITLSYHAEDGSGRQVLLAPACIGTLSQGTGSCTQTYDSPAPIGGGPGSVTGITEPHHYPLGPVVPTHIAGTPGAPGLPDSPSVPGQ